jgi:hypothetical protein
MLLRRGDAFANLPGLGRPAGVSRPQQAPAGSTGSSPAWLSMLFIQFALAANPTALRAAAGECRESKQMRQLPPRCLPQKPRGENFAN